MISDEGPLRFEGIDQISWKVIAKGQVSLNEAVRLPRSVARSDSAGRHANGRPVRAGAYAKVGKLISEAVAESNSVPGVAARTYRDFSVWEEIVWRTSSW